MNDEAFEQLIDEAVSKLSSDNAAEGVEALTEIAQVFAKAGFKQKQFLEIREYIIRTAKERAVEKGIPLFFIEDKIKQAESDSHERRTGKRSTIILPA